MSIWLLLILAGVVMLILGIAIEVAEILIWIGIAVLVIGVIMHFVRRGSSRV